jgi:hypothetical protein
VRSVVETKPHHVQGHGRAARTNANDSILEFKNQELAEIFVPHGDTMRSTIAVSNAIVITVLFECDKDGKSKWKGKDGTNPVPAVYQRRIDILYHNKYLARLTVQGGDLRHPPPAGPDPEHPLQLSRGVQTPSSVETRDTGASDPTATPRGPHALVSRHCQSDAGVV